MATTRPFVIAGTLAVVLWIQTVIDQFVGTGNLGKVLSSKDVATTPSRDVAIRTVAEVLASPKGYLRPGFAEFNPAHQIGNDAQVAVLGAMAATSFAGVVICIWRRRRVATAGLVVASTALVAAVIDSKLLPSTSLRLAANNYRFLWPTASFLVIGVGCAVGRFAPGRGRRLLVASSTGVLLVATIANVATSYQVQAPAVYPIDLRATRDLVEQLQTVPMEGPVVVDLTRLYFGEPYGYATVFVLQERGIDFRFDDPVQLRRFGAERASKGTEQQRLTLWTDEDAILRRSGADTVAYVMGQFPTAVTLTTTE